MIRYSEIPHKQAREIVLLKGGPCVWGRCAFCDYIQDNDPDPAACARLNREVLAQVTGKYGALEVINSASVFELPRETLCDIRRVAREKGINRLFFECYWSYRDRLDEIRSFFGLPVVFKCGIETFDGDFRNRVLKKGIVFQSPDEVARYFDSVCLLVGVKGQTREMIDRDIEILQSRFRYGCINLFQNNATPIRRDEALVQWFCEKYQYLQDDPRIDVLLENTDFGVGGKQDAR